MDHSKAHDHRRMAQLELTAAHRPEVDPEQEMHLRRAQVHATLAVADAQRELTKWVREVADQLDARAIQVRVDGKQVARVLEQGNKAMRKGGAA